MRHEKDYQLKTPINSKPITFIGSGNLASNLALAFDQKGLEVQQVYSRNVANATLLSEKLSSSSVIDNLDFSKSDSELYIIAVTDDEITEVINNLKIPDGSIVVHTSGSVSIDALSGLESDIHTGIFYPLQTFKKDAPIDFDEVPILYESKNQDTKLFLNELGNTISSQVKFTNSEERKVIHLAAVFASNFTNRMLAASELILKEKNLPLELLKPLAIRSIENCFATTPDKVLTGPAIRRDQETIDEHIRMLESHPDLKALYQKISDQILKF